MKNKFFTRKFVPTAQSLQVLERHGYFYENRVMWDRFVLKRKGVEVCLEKQRKKKEKR